jgi:MOSC domain-containing protein YiiM
MFEGKLIAIAIAPSAGAQMQAVAALQAVAGHGLEGDRYANLKGTFQRGRTEPKQQVTLIEEEAIQSAARDYQLPVTHLSMRRNLLTRGVPLNHLVGVEFLVGNVRLKGIILCEPCKHLEKISGNGLIEAMRHRGGLRSEILEGGILHVGDTIRPAMRAE